MSVSSSHKKSKQKRKKKESREEEKKDLDFYGAIGFCVCAMYGDPESKERPTEEKKNSS